MSRSERKCVDVKGKVNSPMLQKTAVECTFLPVPDYFTNK